MAILKVEVAAKPLLSFDDCFDELMVNEGGYSNNPADPGGETMWGITKRVAVKNGYTGNMRDLPQATAKTIAKTEYWDLYSCDKLPVAVANEVFDVAYNGGKAAQWLQQSALVLADGVIGPATIAAVRMADPDDIIMRFNAYRLRYLASLNTWPSFGKGWVNRVANHLLQGASQ